MPEFEFSSLALLLAQIAAIALVSRGIGVITRWSGQPMTPESGWATRSATLS